MSTDEQFPVPDGWCAFGTHVDSPVRLEFSEQVGDDGMPLWERPVSTDPLAEAGEAYYRAYGWSGCAGSAWDRLAPATKDGWRHAEAEHQKVAALLADESTVEKVADAICISASGWPDHHGAWVDEAHAALDVIAGLIGGEE